MVANTGLNLQTLYFMGDEVTKRDLQNLQASVNKQIADLKGRIDNVKDEGQKDGQDLDKIIVRVRQDVDKEIAALEKRLDGMQDAINTLAKAVADASKKADRGFFG